MVDVDYEGIEKYVLGEYANPNDQMQIVLRGHLFIESLLTDLVKSQFPQPDALQFDRMNFDTKLKLARAFEVVSPAEFAAYKKLNKFRNSFAHDVRFELTAQQISDLSNSLQSGSLQILNKFYMQHMASNKSAPEHILRLRYTLVLLYVELSLKRDTTMYKKSTLRRAVHRRQIAKHIE